ncbi:MAG: glycosyltransferase family protein [Planctomycetota bacterium]|jgi:colanic acid/amylovoran biosynthesis glycosyltransferase
MRIAHVVQQFPTLSETFILSQLAAQVRRGHDLDILAERRGDDTRTHEDVDRYDLAARTVYRAMPAGRVVRLAGAARLLVTRLVRRPRALLGALDVARHGALAASGRLVYTAAPLLGRGPYDVAHCHFGPMGLLGLALQDMGLLPGALVTTFYGYDVTQVPRSRGRDVYRRLFERGTRFLALSERSSP